jgi:hypothetical protein
MKRFDRKLSVIVQDFPDESFVANDDVFIKDNVAINSTGIAIRNNPKTFTLVYEELEMVSIIVCCLILLYIGLNSFSGGYYWARLLECGNSWGPWSNTDTACA